MDPRPLDPAAVSARSYAGDRILDLRQRGTLPSELELVEVQVQVSDFEEMYHYGLLDLKGTL